MAKPKAKKLKQFVVSLKDNEIDLRTGKPFVFEAADPNDAVEQFKQTCGILKTEHQFKVTDVAAKGDKVRMISAAAVSAVVADDDDEPEEPEADEAGSD